jgi:hypothetical protein
MTLDVYSHLFPPEAADDRTRFADAEQSVLVAARSTSERV